MSYVTELFQRTFGKHTHTHFNQPLYQQVMMLSSSSIPIGSIQRCEASRALVQTLLSLATGNLEDIFLQRSLQLDVDVHVRVVCVKCI